MKWYLYDSGINLILIKKIKHKSFKNLLVTLLSKLDYACTFYLTWLRILQSCFWPTDGPYFALTTFHLQKRYWTELNFLNKRIIQIYTFTLYVEQMLTLNKIPQLRPFFFFFFFSFYGGSQAKGWIRAAPPSLCHSCTPKTNTAL